MAGRAIGELARILRAKRLRWTLRDKFLRAVEEVVVPGQADHVRELERLGQEVTRLDERLRLEVGALGQRLEEQVRAEAQRIIDQTHGYEVRTRRDLTYAGDAQAARESADFVRDHMAAARHLGHPHATLEHGLSLAPSGGMALEFGVYTGTTLTIIAAARGSRLVYGFDSFEGLPDHWRAGFAAGTFALDAPPVVPGADLVPGLFDEVLPGFLQTHPGPVDFLHVDADLYSSATTILENVGPRLRPGSVIVFDEFFNYPGWREHEYRAWTEHVRRTGLTFRYEAFTIDNEQVAVSIITGPEDATARQAGEGRGALDEDRRAAGEPRPAIDSSTGAGSGAG